MIYAARLVLLVLSLACAKHQGSESSSEPSVAPAPSLRVGGQPTGDELRTYAEKGLSVVVDLRGPEEDRGVDERATVEGLGMTYISLPIESRDDLSLANARELDQILASAQGTVLVHCRSGNRVGALVALRAGLEPELSTEAALEIGRQHGLTSLEEHARGVLEQRGSDPSGDAP